MGLPGFGTGGRQEKRPANRQAGAFWHFPAFGMHRKFMGRRIYRSRQRRERGARALRSRPIRNPRRIARRPWCWVSPFFSWFSPRRCGCFLSGWWEPSSRPARSGRIRTITKPAISHALTKDNLEAFLIDHAARMDSLPKSLKDLGSDGVLTSGEISGNGSGKPYYRKTSEKAFVLK